MRDRIISRLESTRLPTDAVAEAEAAVPATVFAAWFVQPLQAAAVLVPVISRVAGLTVMFTRRTNTVRDHAGQISFPGGRAEPGDVNLVATALRETWEETGIAAHHVKVVGYLPAQAVITGYAVAPVVGLVDPGITPVPDPHEVAEIFEVPLAFFLNPANRREELRERAGIRLPTWEYIYGDHRIWGATAQMVNAMVNIINKSI